MREGTRTAEARRKDVAPIAAAGDPPATSDPVDVAAADQPPLVLVAEADGFTRSSIAQALRAQGFVVAEAPDTVRALRTAAQLRPPIVIVGLGGGTIDGFELLRVLRRVPDRAVMLAAGAPGAAAAVRAFDAGADDVVHYPVDLAELMRRVDALERRRVAEARARRDAERAERLRVYSAEAAALLAHDLNNGLAVASANLEILEELASLRGDAGEALAASRRALRRMSGLVRNFLDVGRLEDGTLAVERDDTDLRDLIATVVSIHDIQATYQSARIDVECPEGLRARVDAVLLERILHNLVGNATRYVSQGGVIRVGAHIDGTPDSRVLTLRIANSGPSIPEALQNTLFDKHATGHKRLRHGMGLYFCRLACEAHGGSIALENEPEFGACFVLRLPC